MKHLPEEWHDLLRELSPVSVGARNEIAIGNMLIFRFDPADVARMSGAVVGEFIEKAFLTYQNKLGGNDVPFWFYSWFDPQAGQLRCSAAPCRGKEDLPFGGRISVTDNAEVVAMEALSWPHGKGIPWKELRELAPGERVKDPPMPPLTVFARLL